MPPDRYRTIVVDPPWPQPRPGGPWKTGFGGNPGALPYRSMPLSEIEGLPIEDLSELDAHLYVWTTNSFIERTYGLVRSWGFKPSATLVWAKTPRGLGPGGTFAVTTEFVVFATRGALAPLQRGHTTWWNWKRGVHSAKPDAFLDEVERVSPGPYVELFARRARFGWDYWGDQSLGTAEMPDA
jgi:N6-adenosine-specific RNA methylase IME4